MNTQEQAPGHFIAVGYTGDMRCYLGVSEDKAKELYLKETGQDEDNDITVKRVEIVNGTFQAYDAWSTSP